MKRLGPQQPDAVKPTLVMLQRFAIWVIFVGLVGAGDAVCQGQRPLSGVAPGSQVTTPHAVAVPQGAKSLLPDAPSAAVATQTGAVEDAFGQPRALKSEGSLGRVAAAPPPNFAMVYETLASQKEPSDFLSRFLSAALNNQNPRYRASSNDRWMGRATDAASSIFVTRDESGRRRLNTSYFVAVLSSVAVHSASRPYWARSTSAPLGDFGSMVGNDAGMNLLHEFGPELREAVAGHMPSFVFKIEQRVSRGSSPRQATLNSAR